MASGHKNNNAFPQLVYVLHIQQPNITYTVYRIISAQNSDVTFS